MYSIHERAERVSQVCIIVTPMVSAYGTAQRVCCYIVTITILPFYMYSTLPYWSSDQGGGGGKR